MGDRFGSGGIVDGTLAPPVHVDLMGGSAPPQQGMQI